VKLLRTIRFDASDERVFEIAAPAGEWAISGAFAFACGDPGGLVGKARQAFANGFLGLGSFGRSTFAIVAEATEPERRESERLLAQHLVARYGAPDLAAALPAAEQEMGFAADLCAAVPINTVFTVRRFVDAAGEIREEFRTIKPPAGEPLHARIWTVESE
jgi:hypothetical protein